MHIDALFLSEGKTRFVAWVEVGGHRRKAYVPMSTKLSRYFDPVGKAVKLELRGKRLWVEQVLLHGKWVWVDAGKAVELLKAELEREGKLVETEKTVAGYRFDLWRDGVGYEVKSVLSEEEVVAYPNAESERRDKQLKRLRGLVRQGVRVVWAFVILSPSCLGVDLDKKFGRALFRAVKSGLRVGAWQCVRRRLRRVACGFVRFSD